MLTRDGTAEPISRDQILRHERGLGKKLNFFVQLTMSRIGMVKPVCPYSAESDDHTYMEREAHFNWSIVTCQGSTRMELP